MCRIQRWWLWYFADTPGLDQASWPLYHVAYWSDHVITIEQKEIVKIVFLAFNVKIDNTTR